MHPRGFGFGGQLREDHTGPMHVIICDDEVCCVASERELFCWRFEGCTRGQTPAKTKGSARHLAGLAMEVGNGFISMDHGGATGTPPLNGGAIMLEDLEKYSQDRAKGLDPVIPRHAQVIIPRHAQVIILPCPGDHAIRQGP